MGETRKWNERECWNKISTHERGSIIIQGTRVLERRVLDGAKRGMPGEPELKRAECDLTRRFIPDGFRKDWSRVRARVRVRWSVATWENVEGAAARNWKGMGISKVHSAQWPASPRHEEESSCTCTAPAGGRRLKSRRLTQLDLDQAGTKSGIGTLIAARGADSG